MLREGLPGRRFEVINTSITAINSNVILPIARECAGHRPDLVIVFMGNNEVVGPFGAAGILGAASPSRSLIRANLLAKSTRTGQLLDDGLRRLWPAKDAPRFWRGMEMFLERWVPADDPRLRATYAHFRANLRDIVAAGVGSGARVIVCTIPVNLRDCAPFASLHGPGLSPAARAAWERAFGDGARLEAAGRPADALRRYDDAARIDDRFAEVPFRRGRLLAALGRMEEAARSFAMARDLDALRFRADSVLNETIRCGTRSAPAGVLLVDAERELAASSPGGIPGEDLFYEHVHLNFHGNYLVARGLFRRIVALLPRAGDAAEPLPESACAARLAYTARERAADVAKVIEMLREPPFSQQSGAASRAARLEERWRALRADLGPEAVRDSLAACRAALAVSPDDWMLRMHLADLLAESGDPARAAENYRGVLERVPHCAPAHFKLATIYLRMKDYRKADDGFRAALRAAPGFAGAHYGRAEVLAARGRFEEAIAIYDRRVEEDPDRAEALRQEAAFLDRVGRPGRARACLEEAVGLDPADALVRVDLGNALARQGAIGAAMAHYEAALRLRPHWRAVAEHLARLRALRGDATGPAPPRPGGSVPRAGIGRRSPPG
jgi:tetratricopeptide (TPR) repeat protein